MEQRTKMLRDEIVVMPPMRRLGRVRRAFKRARSAELALLMPPSAVSLADVPGLTEVFTWAELYAKNLTLIGGAASLRAEAIACGWRVASDATAWTNWRVANQQRVPMPTSGQAVRLT